MKIVDMHEAEMHLSRLVEGALAGEAFIIAKGGRPLVQVTALASQDQRPQRSGFLAGRLTVPEDFDTMGSIETAERFEGRRCARG